MGSSLPRSTRARRARGAALRATAPCALACLWLALAALAPARASAKVYFSAFLGAGGTGIERAGFDGSELQTLQLQPVGFEDGVALDMRDGKMYWTDTNASVIERANLNGSEAEIVLDDFGREPLGIALDVAGGEMYYTDHEGVERAGLDGSKPELVSEGPARGFLALDLQAQQVYWADWPSGTIKSAPMTAGASATTLVSKQVAPFGVAVDHAEGKVYWLQLNLNKKKIEKNIIRSANLDGSEALTLIERPGAGFEGGLALDLVARKIYWAEAEAHDIAVANLDGSQPQVLFSTGEDSPEGLAIETEAPRPLATSQPAIEGTAQVGTVLSCNPGTWTGTGPVSLGYQWLAGGVAIEGANAGWLVPSSDLATHQLACEVIATDNVESSTATSAPVTIAPYPVPPPPALHLALVGGIAILHMTSSGTTARIPVFTSLAARATLTATRTPTSGARKGPRHRAHAALGRGARAHPNSHARAFPRTLTVRRELLPGRSSLTLRRLLPGARYRLVLTIRSPDGQSARASAWLRVARR